MCYPVQCPRCGKTGWGGCGQHAEAVMRAVPPSRRCVCNAEAAAPAGGGDTHVGGRLRHTPEAVGRPHAMGSQSAPPAPRRGSAGWTFGPIRADRVGTSCHQGQSDQTP